MTVALYLVLQLFVAGLSIHRVPHFTAILLLSLLGLAAVSGLVFREGRSFCKAFCPASALLSVYSRFTPLQLEARQPSTCDACSTKDCVRAKNRNRFDKRSCPSLLVPYRREPSDGCVLCLQCAKVCPHNNMGFGLVAESAPIRRRQQLRPFEAAFVMIALGFVAHEVIGELKWLDVSFHRVPSGLQMLMPAIPFGWFEALWFLVLFPILVWTLIAGVGYLAGHRSGLRSLLFGAATGAAPIVAIAHLAKAVAKIGSWGGFLPLALQDPRGVATFSRLTDHSLTAPTALLGLNTVGSIALAVTALLIWRGWLWSRHLPDGAVVPARTGLTTTGALFSAVLLVWALTAG
jgi:polyferredoxin